MRFRIRCHCVCFFAYDDVLKVEPKTKFIANLEGEFGRKGVTESP